MSIYSRDLIRSLIFKMFILVSPVTIILELYCDNWVKIGCISSLNLLRTVLLSFFLEAGSRFVLGDADFFSLYFMVDLQLWIYISRTIQHIHTSIGSNGKKSSIASSPYFMRQYSTPQLSASGKLCTPQLSASRKLCIFHNALHNRPHINLICTHILENNVLLTTVYV